MRLHIGSGSVYLRGWLNVDLPSPRCFLASERPDLVADYGTDAESYYARHDAPGDKPQRAQEYVCDAFGRWDFLPCKTGEAVEALARQTFEHLSAGEAHDALLELRRVCAPGAKVRISVPDHEETLRQFQAKPSPFLIRHLLGPRTDATGFHMQSYTRVSLVDLFAAHGFVLDGDDLNPHSYPALALKFRKVG